MATDKSAQEYESRYAELYLGNEFRGADYDSGVSNKFELAITQLETEILRKIFSHCCNDNPLTKYLDFACGTGRIMSIFNGRIEKIVGVDTSLGQLEVAGSKVPDAELVHDNIVTSPQMLEGRIFNFVTVFRLFLNLEPSNRLPILRALNRLIEIDGLLVVDNHMNRYSVLGMMALFIHKVLGWPIKSAATKEMRGIAATMTAREMQKLLKESGFFVEKIYRLCILPGHGSITLLPANLLIKIEKLFSKIPILNLISKNQIFICRKEKSV